MIQIYGSNLAAVSNVATGVPLPTSLGATSISIGGLPAPLFYASPGQIDAQVPFELAPGKQYDVQVSVNGTLSATESIALVSGAPAIAASSGVAIAQHSDFSLVRFSAGQTRRVHHSISGGSWPDRYTRREQSGFACGSSRAPSRSTGADGQREHG